MTSIDDIILKSTNPFDNIRSVNFWDKNRTPEPNVNSIHQEAIATIESTLDLVILDHRTRTVLLKGDGGSGKTYLLGRLKKKFNNKAFFAYIPPFPQSDYIWRHILRYTVNSLLNVPEGQKYCQLILWLMSVLCAIKQRNLKQPILKDDIFDLLRNDRQKFINKLKNIYNPANIYNADIFFGMLHDLTKPELRTLACEWLRGDDLSEESLQALRVKKSIATEGETTAREILANFGKIAIDTKPIVLCFDQLESIATLPNGSIDLPTLFNVNSKICDEDTNFLVLIGITTNTWQHHKTRIDKTHQARISKQVDLKDISPEQAESLLASRLYHLHCQTDYLTDSPIYPISRKHLEDEFPGGKANPRNVLMLGQYIFQTYKERLAGGKTEPEAPLCAFRSKWTEEFNKVKQQITKITDLSSPELIQMLKETLNALKVEQISIPLLREKYLANCSLHYKLSPQGDRIGIVWTEDQNMHTFYGVMKACQTVVGRHSVKLRFIRAEALSNNRNQGRRIYSEIFTDRNSPHFHVTPNLQSVRYMATYYNLAKYAREGDLFIGGKTVGLQELRILTGESNVLENCSLLNRLGIINNQLTEEEIAAKNFVLGLVTTHHVIGRNILVQNTCNEFTMLNENKINKLIEQLCKENNIRIINSTARPEAQSICLVINR